MKPKYHVLIIGAGNIASEFDNPKDSNILTHAHAIVNTPSLNLVGFVDIDIKKAKLAAEKWNCNAFSTIEAAMQNKTIDIAVVAVPDSAHFSVLEELSKFSMKCVIVEKPLATNSEDARKIIQIYKTLNIPLIVNYTRRFLPEILNIKSEIESRLHGEFLFGTGYYGKGIIHNGSHLVDLLRFLLGDINVNQVTSHSYDFYEDDPSISAILSVQGNPFYIQHVNCQNYTIFELDLIFDESRIKIINSGFQIEIYKKMENPLFKGYYNLVKSREFDTTLNKNMMYLYQNVMNTLSDPQKNKCTAEDANESLLLCISLKKSLKNQGKVA